MKFGQTLSIVSWSSLCFGEKQSTGLLVHSPGAFYGNLSRFLCRCFKG